MSLNATVKEMNSLGIVVPNNKTRMAKTQDLMISERSNNSSKATKKINRSANRGYAELHKCINNNQADPGAIPQRNRRRNGTIDLKGLMY